MGMIVDVISFEEGYRESAYYDSLGFPTIGIGKLIGKKDTPLEYYPFKVSLPVAKLWLSEDVEEIKGQLLTKHWFMGISPERQGIIVSMVYQLGLSGFLKFKNTIKAIEEGDYDKASWEMLDSVWYQQTPNRASRHAEVMRTSRLEPTYDFGGKHDYTGIRGVLRPAE